VDRDTVINQFSELENRIDYLIRTCKRLEAESAALKEENQALTTQLQEIMETQKQNDELKDLVVSKIDSLMGRLDEYSEE
jgi:regulator of replication initiation timing